MWLRLRRPTMRRPQTHAERRAPEQRLNDLDHDGGLVAPPSRFDFRQVALYPPSPPPLNPSRGVATWVRTGKLPTDLPEESRPYAPAESGEPLGSLSTAGSLFVGKLAEGATTAPLPSDRAVFQQQIGPGQPLDGGIRSRMEA